MAITSSRLGETLTRKARSTLGIRFGRFAIAAISAFATTEIVLTICVGPLNLSSTWSSLISWFSGALVSYVLSRWAWKRKGRPNVLRETLPFWIVSAMVVAVLTLANKFGYHSAGWWHLHGAERVLYLDAVYGVANFGTFVLRFLFFHYVLFAGSAARPGPAASEEALASTDPGPDIFAARATDPGDAEPPAEPPVAEPGDRPADRER